MTNHRSPWVLAATALAAAACATTELDDHAVTTQAASGAAGGGLVGIYDVTTASGVARIATLTQSDVPGMAPETGDRFGASLAHADLDADLFDDGTAVAAGRFGDVDDDATSRNDAPADFAAGAPFRQPNGVASAGTFQEFYGQSGG